MSANQNQNRADAGAGPGWRATLALLQRLPQPAMSRAFGRLADVRIPRPLRPAVLRAFARAVGADLMEVELPLVEYATLDSFFVRRLRPGARPWPAEPTALGSPVDGIIGQTGMADGDTLLQAKGRTYSAAALLGDASDAAAFRGGVFATLYLSPRHYHRIHSPASGVVVAARHVPGALMPVNRVASAHLANLFPRNERVIAHLATVAGAAAVVAIGAYNVGRISAAFDPAWADGRGVSNRRGARPETRRYDPARRVERGDELMAFHLGSTVVLLFEAGRVRLVDGLRPGMEVRLGQPLGHVV